MIVDTSYEFEDLNFDVIVPETQSSYWARGRSRDGIIRSFKNSFTVSLRLRSGEQVGWARIVSDEHYHAYVGDVQILPQYRGQGFGKRLVQDVLDHPELGNVSSWLLATRDQHELYRKFGFEDAVPGKFMTMLKTDAPD
ncbi:MAG: GNAT family N-acetyltransferase [Pseudomonadota bacterium]